MGGREMPREDIETSTDEPRKYVPPHERKNGPWDSYELEDMGHHLERAEQIGKNPKLVEAIAKHQEKKAATHRKMAGKMRGHMKRGLVSDRQYEKAKAKHG